LPRIQETNDPKSNRKSQIRRFTSAEITASKCRTLKFNATRKLNANWKLSEMQVQTKQHEAFGFSFAVDLPTEWQRYHN